MIHFNSDIYESFVPQLKFSISWFTIQKFEKLTERVPLTIKCYFLHDMNCVCIVNHEKILLPFGYNEITSRDDLDPLPIHPRDAISLHS